MMIGVTDLGSNRFQTSGIRLKHEDEDGGQRSKIYNDYEYNCNYNFEFNYNYQATELSDTLSDTLT